MRDLKLMASESGVSGLLMLHNKLQAVLSTKATLGMIVSHDIVASDMN